MNVLPGLVQYLQC